MMCPYVYLSSMAGARSRRINVTLEPDYARKLASLAERTHVQEGTLARSLLSSALDEADPDASRITEILDVGCRDRSGLSASSEGCPLFQGAAIWIG